MNVINELLNNLDTLKLYGVKEDINMYLDYIANNEKTPLDAFNELFKREISRREKVAEIACVKVANFPFQRDLNEFNFDFQPSIDKRKIMDLATLRFLETNENIIFCGTPGVGKTHLAVALGTIAAKQ